MSNDVRSEIVTGLVDEMTLALELCGEGASVNEVMSACFTLTLRMMKGCAQMGADPYQLRAAVDVLLLQCAPIRLN